MSDQEIRIPRWCLLGFGLPLVLSAVMGLANAVWQLPALAQRVEQVQKDIDTLDTQGTKRLRGVEERTATERNDLKTSLARLEERQKSISSQLDRIVNLLEEDE